MAYSKDLKERVVAYVRKGGKKSEAARRFSVCEATVYLWIQQKDLTPQQPPGRPRSFSWEKLKKHVEDFPDKMIKERAIVFGVAATTILYALQQMEISYKKNAAVQTKKL